VRSIILLVFAAASLTACADPIAQQAARDTRHDPVRADKVLAISFHPGSGRLDPGQAGQLKAMVAAGQAAQRGEFVVVTDGSGGPIQNARAQEVRLSLAHAGARWVSTSVEPTMAMGPNQVVVVRSEYRIGEYNCPNYMPAEMANINEAAMPGFGCADAYNMGKMLARPRDAAVGREPGPADGTVGAESVQRYREGRARAPAATGVSSTGQSAVGGGSGGATTGGTSGSSGSPPPTN